jgi:hypothetical protein
MMASDATVIRTLRIRTTAFDRLAARQQTERALQAASLYPIGLPRNAILIVRHITSRQIGAAGWEQAVNAELDQLARQAARPIEGAVPANAPAVIFADRAELLACLAADWCAGVVRAQWWWQSLLRDDDLTRAIIDAWLAAPEYVPLALQRLSARQQALAFVQRLSDTHADQILQALVHTFGLYELSLALTEISAMESIDREVITAPPAPPWRPWMQAPVEHLSPERQVLLAVGSMLISAPSIARSASFALEVKTWHAALHAAQQPSPPVVSTAAEAIEPIRQSAQEASAPTSTRPEETIKDQPSLRGALSATKQSPSQPHAQPVDVELTSSSSVVPEKTVLPHIQPSAALQIQKSPHNDDKLSEALDVPEAVSTSIEIETEFGGVCYFINLGLFLNLYGDFTTPLQPGLDLPIWDFMALVAQDLLGDDVTRDPIWPLLAQLADRAEDEPPGLNIDLPDDWSRGFSRDSGPIDQPAAPSGPPSHRDGYGQASTPDFAELMSLIRPRLRLALGANEENLPRYFKQHARVVVSALTFDAYFALADLPIEIRLSGLDRNPGWVPAAGRTVRFHYD